MPALRRSRLTMRQIGLIAALVGTYLHGLVEYIVLRPHVDDLYPLAGGLAFGFAALLALVGLVAWSSDPQVWIRVTQGFIRWGSITAPRTAGLVAGLIAINVGLGIGGAGSLSPVQLSCKRERTVTLPHWIGIDVLRTCEQLTVLTVWHPFGNREDALGQIRCAMEEGPPVPPIASGAAGDIWTCPVPPAIEVTFVSKHDELVRRGSVVLTSHDEHRGDAPFGEPFELDKGPYRATPVINFTALPWRDFLVNEQPLRLAFDYQVSIEGNVYDADGGGVPGVVVEVGETRSAPTKEDGRFVLYDLPMRLSYDLVAYAVDGGPSHWTRNTPWRGTQSNAGWSLEIQRNVQPF